MAEELNTDNEPQETPAVQSVMSAQPKTLSVADVKSKIDTQTPLYSDEYLPSAPKNMSAKGFYGQFKGYGGASVYSQPPFASSLSTVQGTSFLPQRPAETSPQEEINVPDVTIAPVQPDESFDQDISAQMDDLFVEDTDNNYLTDYLPDIDKDMSYWDQLTNSFVDLNELSIDETGIDWTSFENTLFHPETGLSARFSESMQEGKENIDKFMEEAEVALTPYLQNFPVGAITTVADKFLTGIQEFGENFKNLSDPNNFDKSVEYFAGAFKDTIVAQFISKMAFQFGAGALSGPFGMLAAALMSEGEDIHIGEIGFSNFSYTNEKDSLLGKNIDDLRKIAAIPNDKRISVVAGKLENGWYVDKDGQLMMKGEFTNTVLTSITPYLSGLKGLKDANTISSKDWQAHVDHIIERDGMPFGKEYTEEELSKITPVEVYTTPLKNVEEEEKVVRVTDEWDDLSPTMRAVIKGQADKDTWSKLPNDRKQELINQTKEKIAQMRKSGDLTKVSKNIDTFMTYDRDSKKDKNNSIMLIANDMYNVNHSKAGISLEDSRNKTKENISKVLSEISINIALEKNENEKQRLTKNFNELKLEISGKFKKDFGLKPNEKWDDAISDYSAEEAESFTDFMTSVGTDPNRSEESKETTFDAEPIISDEGGGDDYGGGGDDSSGDTGGYDSSGMTGDTGYSASDEGGWW